MTDPLVEHVARRFHAGDRTNTCRPDGFAQQGLCDCVHRAEVAVAAVRERPDLLGLRWHYTDEFGTRTEGARTIAPVPTGRRLRRLVGEWEPAS